MHRDAKNLVKIAINYGGQREGLVRQYFFTFARRFTPSLAVDSGDLRFHLSTSEEEGRITFGARGLDEVAMEELVRVLAQHTGVAEPLKGRVVLDVGGNIGTSSVYATRRYGAKGTIAFEPAPANLRMLRLNLLENDVTDVVKVMAVALSDVDGEVGLELSPENSGDHRVRTGATTGEPSLIGEEHREVVTVQSRRLDTLVAEGEVDLTDVALIWMDVQGHEGHVLNGALETMKHGIPVILEYWRYGLERAGGLDLLHAIIAGHFSRVVDMGSPWSQSPPTVLAAADVAQLAERYSRPEVFVDLLLLP
jgi:FkbM family methyltransferase